MLCGLEVVLARNFAAETGVETYPAHEMIRRMTVSVADYKKRRSQLMSMMSPGSEALIPAPKPGAA
jgi:hypothetical protein